MTLKVGDLVQVANTGSEVYSVESVKDGDKLVCILKSDLEKGVTRHKYIFSEEELWRFPK